MSEYNWEGGNSLERLLQKKRNINRKRIQNKCFSSNNPTSSDDFLDNLVLPEPLECNHTKLERIC